jgi:hypothetical protein
MLTSIPVHDPGHATAGYFYDAFAYEICFYGIYGTSTGRPSTGYSSTKLLNLSELIVLL